MLHSHYTEKILGLQEAEIKNIQEEKEKIEIINRDATKRVRMSALW